MGIVIVGWGPAAHRLVTTLRRLGHTGPVTVLGAERHPAYHRPLLGSVLGGHLTPEALTLPEAQADLRTGTTVTSVDRRRRTVHTGDGTTHPYDTLVLATGARPRRPLPGGPAGDGQPTGTAPPAGVTALRTLDDVRSLRAALGEPPAPPASVAVVGAGVLGVETAVTLRESGHHVTLVHRAPHPLARRLDATAGSLLAQRLRQLGIRLLLGRAATGHGPGFLLLDDDERVPADHVVLCAGIVPLTGLARRAGLAVGTGILVDERLRTSDPHIHAIGDCAEQQGVLPGGVTTAWEQADTLAGLLHGARPAAPARPPRSVLRLRTRAVELAVFGPPEHLAGGDRTTETVTFQDRSGARYARLVLSEGRVLAGVLLGLPRAAAAVTQLYDRDAPAPADRLSLLLGVPPTTGEPAAPPEDCPVCDCNNVSRAALRQAWQDGARDLYALVAATRATTGCGGCADDVRAWCAQAGAGSAPRPGDAARCASTVPSTSGGVQ